MKIVAMVGSLSKASINRRLAEFLKDRYKGKMDIEILEIDKLPFYDYEIEEEKNTLLDNMRNSIREADGVLFLTPEYNASIPAILKNAIDWFSRVDQVLIDKPGMILGATPGRLGTVKAQEHLKDILTSQQLGVLLVPRTDILIGSYYDQIDGEGNLVDKDTLGFLDASFENFKKWIEKLR